MEEHTSIIDIYAKTTYIHFSWCCINACKFNCTHTSVIIHSWFPIKLLSKIYKKFFNHKIFLRTFCSLMQSWWIIIPWCNKCSVTVSDILTSCSINVANMEVLAPDKLLLVHHCNHLRHHLPVHDTFQSTTYHCHHYYYKWFLSA